MPRHDCKESEWKYSSIVFSTIKMEIIGQFHDLATNSPNKLLGIHWISGLMYTKADIYVAAIIWSPALRM